MILFRLVAGFVLARSYSDSPARLLLTVEKQKISRYYLKYRDILMKIPRIPIKISVKQKIDNIGEISSILSIFKTLLVSPYGP